MHRLDFVGDRRGPAYVLTDNEKTMAIDRVAGVAVRHPQVVAAGRHYGLQVHMCVPFDPESKGGSEATVRIAKADLIPISANPRNEYGSFAELRGACAIFCQQVNTRVHRETGKTPASMLDIERTRLHLWGLVGQEAWARADGEELVVVVDLSQLAHEPQMDAGPGRADGGRPASAVSLPGRPVIDLAHYPNHPQDLDGSPRQPKPKPANDAEGAFLALGRGRSPGCRPAPRALPGSG